MKNKNIINNGILLKNLITKNEVIKRPINEIKFDLSLIKKVIKPIVKKTVVKKRIK